MLEEHAVFKMPDLRRVVLHIETTLINLVTEFKPLVSLRICLPEIGKNYTALQVQEI